MLLMLARSLGALTIKILVVLVNVKNNFHTVTLTEVSIAVLENLHVFKKVKTSYVENYF